MDYVPPMRDYELIDTTSRKARMSEVRQDSICRMYETQILEENNDDFSDYGGEYGHVERLISDDSKKESNRRYGPYTENIGSDSTDVHKRRTASPSIRSP